MSESDPLAWAEETTWFEERKNPVTSETVEAEIVDDTKAIVPVASDALTEFGKDEIGLERAMTIANQLDSIIKQQGLVANIQGRNHLLVEAWCAVASMVGVSPRTEWTRRLPESGKLEGYIARVQVVQIATGQVIGAAEAGCFTDEMMAGSLRWKDQHAVLSMSQTRATSKAIGQILRWIPVLAGYSGTPAEEMAEPESRPTQDAAAQARKEPNPRQSGRAGGRKASEKQHGMLYKISKNRATEVLEFCSKAGLPCNHQDDESLAGSMRKVAAEALGLSGSKGDVLSRDVDGLKHLIEHATVDEKGDTVTAEEDSGKGF